MTPEMLPLPIVLRCAIVNFKSVGVEYGVSWGGGIIITCMKIRNVFTLSRFLRFLLPILLGNFSYIKITIP